MTTTEQAPTAVQSAAGSTPIMGGGAKIVSSKPTTPIFVTRLRTVGNDRQTIEFQLEQMFEQPAVTPATGILSLAMAGHDKFNTGDRKRIAWQSVSTVNAIRLGYITKWEDVGESQIDTDMGPVMGARLVGPNVRFRLTGPDGKDVPLKLVRIESLKPRSWVDRNGQPAQQKPKQAGQSGDVLTFQGQLIYTNVIVSTPGMDDPATGRKWDEDYVIVHDNQVIGSSVRTNMQRAGIAIGQPNLPAGATRQQADPALQNRRPGVTSNLVHGAPEPTRSGPDEQQQEHAEKTKREEQREAGDRGLEGGN